MRENSRVPAGSDSKALENKDMKKKWKISCKERKTNTESGVEVYRRVTGGVCRGGVCRGGVCRGMRRGVCRGGVCVRERVRVGFQENRAHCFIRFDGNLTNQSWPHDLQALPQQKTCWLKSLKRSS